MYKILQTESADDMESLIQESQKEWFTPQWGVNVCTFPWEYPGSAKFLYSVLVYKDENKPFRQTYNEAANKEPELQEDPYAAFRNSIEIWEVYLEEQGKTILRWSITLDWEVVYADWESSHEIAQKLANTINSIDVIQIGITTYETPGYRERKKTILESNPLPEDE